MPKWRPAPEALVQVFDKAIQALPDVQPRKMFGYPCAFTRGQMFAGLHQESMILRLEENDRTRFLGQAAGVRMFEPMPGRPMREYVVVPQAILTSEPGLAQWLKKSFEYAQSLPPKVKKAPRAKSVKKK
ncbi:MAG: TfoX/Sxy family protein [Anaerolineales bacterium]